MVRTRKEYLVLRSDRAGEADILCNAVIPTAIFLSRRQTHLCFLEVVAKFRGHSTTRMTMHHGKLPQNNILNEVKDAFERSS